MDAKSESKDGGAPTLGAKGDDDLFADKTYEQLYIILKEKPIDQEAKRAEGNEVLFRCGNWCYRGMVQFNNMQLKLSELPLIIPTLQRQQSNLRYFCNSMAVPPSCVFFEPMAFLKQAVQFFAQQMLSEAIERVMQNLAASGACPWLEDDDENEDDSKKEKEKDNKTYFELELDQVPDCMKAVSLLSAKLYTRGLVIVTIYQTGTLFFVVQSGEGDQALLDVRFPNVTLKGEGCHIASYTSNDGPYRKLTLWHLLHENKNSRGPVSPANTPSSNTQNTTTVPRSLKQHAVDTISVSSKNYQQTYCILKSAWEGANPALSMHHDVLFRFGSWCYSGRVQLTPSIQLSDIPFVIPALRMQQSRLEFLCPADKVPVTSPFAGALGYLQQREPDIEEIVENSVVDLEGLVDRLSRMGLGEAVSKWLDGDEANSFFEMKLEPDEAMQKAFKAVELVATKSYHASGVVTVNIWYNSTLYVNTYVCVSDGSCENPLLDSKFPDVSGKGRGYQINNYDVVGHPRWRALKKVSVWQTVNALEQEFRDRAAQGATMVTRSGVDVKPKPFVFGVGATAKDSGDKDGDDDSMVSSLPGISEQVQQGVREANSLLSSEDGHIAPDKFDGDASIGGNSTLGGVRFEASVGTGSAPGHKPGFSFVGLDDADSVSGGEKESQGDDLSTYAGDGNFRVYNAVDDDSVAEGPATENRASQSVVSLSSGSGAGSEISKPSTSPSASSRQAFDVDAHTRIRHAEFERDTRNRNCSALQELKALNDGSTTGPAGSVNSGNSGPSSGPNSNSIGGRISAFNQKAGVVGSGAPDVAEAKENPGSPNTNTKTKALTLAEPTFTASGDLIGNTVQQDKPAPFDPAADLNPLSSFSPNEDNGAKVNNDFGMGGMAMGLAGVEAGGSVSTLGSGGVYNPNSQSQGPVVGAVASNTAAAAANADNSIGNSGKAGSRPLGQLGTVSSQPLSWGGGSSNASKPHHLPKMALSGLQNESLSKKLDSIRAGMEADAGGGDSNMAPWDKMGMPKISDKGERK